MKKKCSKGKGYKGEDKVLKNKGKIKSIKISKESSFDLNNENYYVLKENYYLNQLLNCLSKLKIYFSMEFTKVAETHFSNGNSPLFLYFKFV